MTSVVEDDLEPLGVTCTSTDCENGLHCFLQKKRRTRGALRSGGPCRECGADLVDWKRVRSRSRDDIGNTFEALKLEMIRHVFWHTKFNARELAHAARKGRIRLQDAAVQRIKTSVGRAEHPREGRQTPFSGTVLFHAQHAVAACCRKCIEYWHNIPAGRELRPREISYLVELVVRYLDQRLPHLANHPIAVPRQTKPISTGKK